MKDFVNLSLNTTIDPKYIFKEVVFSKQKGRPYFSFLDSENHIM